MEDPVKEVPIVLQKALTRPTFEGLAELIRTYFTEDVEFYHPYVNVAASMGLEAYIRIFQYALFFLNYQNVLFRDLVYDAQQNIVIVRMTVTVNPWVLLWRRVNLQFLTEFQLEDVIDERTGKILKKIKVQRDYFIRWPLLQAVPIIGDIYDSDKLRSIVGSLTATLVGTVEQGFEMIRPTKLKEALYNFWRERLQVPIWEQSDAASARVKVQ